MSVFCREVLQNGSLYFFPFASEQLRDDVHTTSYRCLASNPAGKIISRECKLRPGKSYYYVKFNICYGSLMRIQFDNVIQIGSAKAIDI